MVGTLNHYKMVKKIFNSAYLGCKNFSVFSSSLMLGLALVLELVLAQELELALELVLALG